ncbi:dsRBD fold-containing protein [Streptomyces prasinus]|uniref:dsRBD fold-containing protein n=1 Tax=Streptomyces prasinus TaxID=67345 RepID=UPI0036819C13
MSHTLEWKARLHFFEEEGTTKTRAVVDTGTAVLTGHGTARRNPADADVPGIGGEPAAGRALQDLGRQLVDIAERDVEETGTTGPGPVRPSSRPM